MDTPQKILVAVDMGPDFETVAEAGVELGSKLGAPVTILHVLTESALAEALESSPKEHAFVDKVVDGLRREMAERLHRAETGDHPQPDVKIVEGEPSEEILRALRDGGFSHAVIGMRDRSRVGKFLLGSVTQEVLLGSARPVVAVPVRRRQAAAGGGPPDAPGD